MSITVKLKNSDAFANALRSMSSDIQDAVSKEVVAAAVELKADIQTKIKRGPASGRVYQKYNPRRTHRASAPGQAPMSDTGRLAGSVVFDVESKFTAVVSSSLPYAFYLEYGTRRMNFAGGVGGPRPVWRPAAEEAETKFQAAIEKAVAGAIK